MFHEDMNLDDTGIPSRTQVLTIYCQFSQSHTQTDGNIQYRKQLQSSPSFNETNLWSGFYLSFLFFKNCVIVHGVAQRASLGVASSAMAHRVANLLPEMVRLTWKILKEFPPPSNNESDDANGDKYSIKSRL